MFGLFLLRRDGIVCRLYTAQELLLCNVAVIDTDCIVAVIETAYYAVSTGAVGKISGVITGFSESRAWRWGGGYLMRWRRCRGRLPLRGQCRNYGR